MKFLNDFLVSRKAQATLVLIVVAFSSPTFIEPDHAESISKALLAYIIGRGLADINTK